MKKDVEDLTYDEVKGYIYSNILTKLNRDNNEQNLGIAVLKGMATPVETSTLISNLERHITYLEDKIFPDDDQKIFKYYDTSDLYKLKVILKFLKKKESDKMAVKPAKDYESAIEALKKTKKQEYGHNGILKLDIGSFKGHSSIDRSAITEFINFNVKGLEPEIYVLYDQKQNYNYQEGVPTDKMFNTVNTFSNIPRDNILLRCFNYIDTIKDVKQKFALFDYENHYFSVHKLLELPIEDPEKYFNIMVEYAKKYFSDSYPIFIMYSFRLNEILTLINKYRKDRGDKPINPIPSSYGIKSLFCQNILIVSVYKEQHTSNEIDDILLMMICNYLIIANKINPQNISICTNDNMDWYFKNLSSLVVHPIFHMDPNHNKLVDFITNNRYLVVQGGGSMNTKLLKGSKTKKNKSNKVNKTKKNKKNTKSKNKYSKSKTTKNKKMKKYGNRNKSKKNVRNKFNKFNKLNKVNKTKKNKKCN